MAFTQDARSWARQQAAPVTIGIIAALVISFLVSWFTRGTPFPYLLFSTEKFLPWSPITYPFADPGLGQTLFWFLIGLFCFFGFGSSVERDLGSKKYALFLVAMALLPVVFYGLGGKLFGHETALAGPNLPVAGLLVAWGAKNRSGIIKIWGIIPITGLILAILTVALVLFGYGTGAPILGALACIHLAVAWFFAENRFPFATYSKPVYQYRPSRHKMQADERYYDDVKKREQERDEKERLRRLFEGSGLDDRE